MNSSVLLLEILVTVLGLGVLLADLWVAPATRRNLGYLAAALVLGIFAFGIEDAAEVTQAFVAPGARHGMYVHDGLSVFFKEFFLLAAAMVLVLGAEFSDRFLSGASEFQSLTLFALLGMMLAASANDLILMFAALELITITFVVLNSFQRHRAASIEAGVKYLILGATASAFLVFGIALVFGSANTTNFSELAALQKTLAGNRLFLAGLLLVLFGLAFKIAAFPFQVWAPDVYQGSPAPATAFLAVGSKAAGFVLLLRLLFGAVPSITAQWTPLLVAVAAITILYGSLCAIPQRNLKRLMGYSSIANAGFLLLGVAAVSKAGLVAVLYYLGGYLFTVLAAFAVLTVVVRALDSDDLSAVAGLGQRSPFLAAALTLSMVSLAGVPPLAGFFGKFLLLKSIIPLGAADSRYYWLLAVAIAGVVMSLYYYFGVIRAIYWGTAPAQPAPLPVSWPLRVGLGVCLAGMLWLGVLPDSLMKVAVPAVEVLRPEAPAAFHAAGR